MIRKTKRYGIALAAVLSLSAFAAPSAHAVEFHSSAEHTIISGSQTTTHTLTAAAGVPSITCTTNTLEGTTAAKTVSSWELTQARSGCKDGLGRTVDFECIGIHRKTFTPNGVLHTTCTGISREKITNGGGVVICTIEYGAQTNNGISYSNLGGTKGVEVTFNTTNLQSTIEGGFFNCGTSTTNATAGTYTGKTVLTAKDTAGNPVELRVE